MRNPTPVDPFFSRGGGWRRRGPPLAFGAAFRAHPQPQGGCSLGAAQRTRLSTSLAPTGSGRARPGSLPPLRPLDRFRASGICRAIGRMLGGVAPGPEGGDRARRRRVERRAARRAHLPGAPPRLCDRGNWHVMGLETVPAAGHASARGAVAEYRTRAYLGWYDQVSPRKTPKSDRSAPRGRPFCIARCGRLASLGSAYALAWCGERVLDPPRTNRRWRPAPCARLREQASPSRIDLEPSDCGRVGEE